MRLIDVTHDVQNSITHGAESGGTPFGSARPHCYSVKSCIASMNQFMLALELRKEFQ